VVPGFAIEAQPVDVPPALAKMPADARVTFERTFGTHLRGTMLAGELCDEIREIISRQAEGFFTLHEAAQVLADTRPDLSPAEHVKHWRKAHRSGALRIHKRRGRYPLEPGEGVNASLDLLEVRALDEWLRASAGYGFPGCAPAGEPVTPVEPAAPVASGGRMHSTKGQKRRDDLWPAIEAAQAECSNPLDTAAVWVALRDMAKEEKPPLLGNEGERIRWQRGGVAAFLTRGALHKRLHPEKRR
jgi:hypothetical protein